MAAESQLYASSVDPSGSSMGGTSTDQDELRFIVVGQKLQKNSPLRNALKHIGAPVEFSENGYDRIADADGNTVFVVDQFEGDIFEYLYHGECRIVAPPVVIRAAENNEAIPDKTRPLYCTAMEGLVLCFSGLKRREQLSQMADLVHRMGGGIRKDFSARVTHLVSMRTGGEKYRMAVSMGTQIMSIDWVYKCWELRDDPTVSATDDALMVYRLSPFSFCVLAFYGFSHEDQNHMEELTVANGGTCADIGAPMCSHLVVEERTVKAVPEGIQGRAIVVRSEWLWASIQMVACADESMYLFEGNENSPPPNDPKACRKTPSSLSAGKSKSHRRKRLRENLAQLAHEGEADTPSVKSRRSGADGGRRSGADNGRRSCGSSLLDSTATDLSTTVVVRNGCDDSHGDQSLVATVVKDSTKLTARQQTVLELFQTECNYVGILHTILKIFKEEIEKLDQPGGPILDAQESKSIFGGVPPIYDAHLKIRDELADIVSNASTDWLVGNAFLKHADALTKAYPTFVNYFEKTKETIQQCDKNKPRFHAFLRLCQSKPECGRQTLTELLIRPVQRLPSVLLLLRDILKRTEKSQSDYSVLNKAIAALEEVMTHINEDKRRTEGHQTLFSIVNDIENCPPNLLSAHRVFLRKINAIEVSGELHGKGTPISLFLFSDSVEIAKRRTKGAGSKSPAITSSSKPPVQKPFKHLGLLPFSSIKRVVDIAETPECRGVFALITKRPDDREEQLCAFALDGETTNKDDLLTSLSKTICDSQCRADYETLMAVVKAHVLNIDASDLHNSKTFARAASRFGKRVSRVLSLKKTPQNDMKRTVSSMAQLSASRRDSTTSSTLSLASLASYGAGHSGTLIAEDAYTDVVEADSYSSIVDMMSLGTPATGRRRGTWATRETDSASVTGIPVTPRLPSRPRHETGSSRDSVVSSYTSSDVAAPSRFGALRKDISMSTQSLAIARSRRQESTTPSVLRTPATQLCRPTESCI